MFMFCPRCGGFKFEFLYGGLCWKGCVYCCKGIHCHEDFSHREIDKNSLPVKNPFRALWLRFLYNRIPGNKDLGKKRIKGNKKFRREQKETARKMRSKLFE
ncbi:MAG: hypothetical protein PHX25_03380 [Candidatus Pacebacteria bacterium]|nr:hypothetical protein [Candidatus Paceibacterota bacterium]